MSFMTIRQGSSLIFVESATGDISGVLGNPTGYLVLARDADDEPEPGAPHIALTVTAEVDQWRLTLLNTSALAVGRYLIYTTYSFVDGSTYIPEPTLLIVKA
jgi:hypothetical protein